MTIAFRKETRVLAKETYSRKKNKEFELKEKLCQD